MPIHLPQQALAGPRACRVLAWALAVGWGAWGTCLAGPSGPVASRDGLLAGYAAISKRPDARLAGRPLYLQSDEADGVLRGEVYAVLDQPFEAVRQALSLPAPWCEVLILHLNVKSCQPSGEPGGSVQLEVGLGRKFEEPLERAHALRLGFQLAVSRPDRLQVLLQAPQGPLGSHDFRIELDAMPLAADRALLRLTYSYGMSRVARWAMQAYLATLGRDKRGFSVVGRDPQGQPLRIDGLRGVLERNAVRYYLAVDVYMGTREVPSERRLEQRLQGWFAATEAYEQLHEVERDAYLSMKRKETQRLGVRPGL
ncbi:MAG: hypothetical protein FGM55_05935 [Rhodoferax sp.]|nr:hypothetical protein [Rhodoferax sp.]